MFELDRLYTTKEIADALGYKERTLEDWRYHGVGPKYARLSPTKGVRYLGRDVQEWLLGQFVAPTR